ncbi:MAG: hypothetical protein ACK5KL_02095 [Dysgonomonas sp.]
MTKTFPETFIHPFTLITQLLSIESPLLFINFTDDNTSEQVNKWR